MNYKRLTYTGPVICIAGLLIGAAGICRGIWSSFEAMKISEAAGIGAVGGGSGRRYLL